eukprot:1950512-Amphidinium_carterae.1
MDALVTHCSVNQASSYVVNRVNQQKLGWETLHIHLALRICLHFSHRLQVDGAADFCPARKAARMSQADSH